MSGQELRVEQARVHFGQQTVLDGVDLVVESGSSLGLVGESGSGKSTLARACVGLTRLDSGRVLLGGDDALGRSQGRRRPIQLVMQDPDSALDPRIRVGPAIAEGMHGARRTDRRAEADRLLDLVGLDPALAERYPRDLSGGQRQRVSLARALAARPDVLIADEITSALDVSVQGAVLNVLRQVQSELGLTLLFISHNLAVVRYLCDSVAVLNAGRIVETGTAEQITDAPTDPYTRTLVAANPVMGQGFPPAEPKETR